MPQIVESDGVEIEFPDDMSEDDIAQALSQQQPELEQSQARIPQGLQPPSNSEELAARNYWGSRRIEGEFPGYSPTGVESPPIAQAITELLSPSQQTFQNAGEVVRGAGIARNLQQMGIPVNPDDVMANVAGQKEVAPGRRAQIAAGLQHTGAGLVGSLADPVASGAIAASILLPPIAPLVSGGFMAHMGAQVPELARIAGEASVTGTPYEKVTSLGNLAATSIFTVGTGLHTGKAIVKNIPRAMEFVRELSPGGEILKADRIEAEDWLKQHNALNASIEVLEADPAIATDPAKQARLDQLKATQESVGLSKAHQKIIDDQSLDSPLPVEVVWGKKRKPGQYSGVRRSPDGAPEAIEFYGESVPEYVQDVARKKRGAAINRTVDEEVIHAHTSKADAELVAKSAGKLERWVAQKNYGRKVGEGGMTERDLGYEIIRQRIQRMTGETREAVEASFEDKLGIRGLEILSDAVRAIGDRLGSIGAGRTRRAVERTLSNIEAAKAEHLKANPDPDWSVEGGDVIDIEAGPASVRKDFKGWMDRRAELRGAAYRASQRLDAAREAEGLPEPTMENYGNHEPSLNIARLMSALERALGEEERHENRHPEFAKIVSGKREWDRGSQVGPGLGPAAVRKTVTESDVDRMTPADIGKLGHPDGIRYGITLTEKDVARLEQKYGEASKEMKAGFTEAMAAMKDGDQAKMVAAEEKQRAAFGKNNFYGGALQGATKGQHKAAAGNYELFRQMEEGGPAAFDKNTGKGLPLTEKEAHEMLGFLRSKFIDIANLQAGGDNANSMIKSLGELMDQQIRNVDWILNDASKMHRKLSSIETVGYRDMLSGLNRMRHDLDSLRAGNPEVSGEELGSVKDQPSEGEPQIGPGTGPAAISKAAQERIRKQRELMALRAGQEPEKLKPQVSQKVNTPPVDPAERVGASESGALPGPPSKKLLSPGTMGEVTPDKSRKFTSAYLEATSEPSFEGFKGTFTARFGAAPDGALREQFKSQTMEFLANASGQKLADLVKKKNLQSRFQGRGAQPGERMTGKIADPEAKLTSAQLEMGLEPGEGVSGVGRKLQRAVKRAQDATKLEYDYRLAAGRARQLRQELREMGVSDVTAQGQPLDMNRKRITQAGSKERGEKAFELMNIRRWMDEVLDPDKKVRATFLKMKEDTTHRKSGEDEGMLARPAFEARPPAKTKTFTKAQQRRYHVIATLYDALAKEADIGKKSASRKTVTPDDLGSQLVAKEPVFYRISNEELKRPSELAIKLTNDARTSGGKVSLTHRLMAMVNNRTGAVDLVDVYLDGRRGPVVMSSSGLGGHQPFETVLRTHRPLYSVYLDEPVVNFHQRFKTLREFENQFGRDAARRTEGSEFGAGTGSELMPSGGTTGKKAIAGSMLQAPGELERSMTGPLNEREAGAVLDHILEETGKFESVDDVITAVDALHNMADSGPISRRKLPVIAGLEKMFLAIRRQNPELSAGQALEKLYENIYEGIQRHGYEFTDPQSGKQRTGYHVDEFQRETVGRYGGTVEPVVPEGQEAAPSPTSQELTTPTYRKPIAGSGGPPLSGVTARAAERARAEAERVSSERSAKATREMQEESPEDHPSTRRLRETARMREEAEVEAKAELEAEAKGGITGAEFEDNPAAVNKRINPKQDELLKSFYVAANSVAKRTKYGYRIEPEPKNGFVLDWSNARSQWDAYYKDYITGNREITEHMKPWLDKAGITKLPQDHIWLDANQIVISAKSRRDAQLIAESLPPHPLSVFSAENNPTLTGKPMPASELIDKLREFWKQEPASPNVVEYTERFMDKIRSPEQTMPDGDSPAAIHKHTKDAFEKLHGLLLKDNKAMFDIVPLERAGGEWNKQDTFNAAVTMHKMGPEKLVEAETKHGVPVEVVEALWDLMDSAADHGVGGKDLNEFIKDEMSGEQSFPAAIIRRKRTPGQATTDAIRNTGAAYEEWMMDRIARVGGPSSKEAATKFKSIIDRAKELKGSLAPVLDPARVAAGASTQVKIIGQIPSIKGVRATAWLNGLNKVTPFAATARMIDALEGSARNVPDHVQKIIDLAKTANLAIGRMHEKSSPGFHAGGKAARNVTALGYDSLRQGQGDIWQKWTAGLSRANHYSINEVRTFFTEWKATLDEPGSDMAKLERVNQDFVRKFPNVITHVKSGGQWQAVVHADLFNYLENAAQRAAHIRAFREAFPAPVSGWVQFSAQFGSKKQAHAVFKRQYSGPDGKKQFKEDWPVDYGGQRSFEKLMTDVRAELGPEHQKDLDALIRTLQGHPTDNYASWGMLAPTHPIGAVFKALNQTVGQLMAKMVLTGQMFVQAGENIAGSTPQFLGYKNYLRGMSRLRQVYGQMEQQGSVNRVMYDFSFDPNAKWRSSFRIAGNVISKAFAEQFLNELQEGSAAATAMVVAERIKAKTLTDWERRMLPQTFRMMGFTEAEGTAMMGGDVKLLDQFERKAAASLTSGNKAVSESSRLGANRLFNSIFRFQTYPMMKMRQFRAVTANLAEALEKGTPEQREAATEAYSRFMFGTVMQGAITTAVTTLFYQGWQGAKIRSSEAQDEPIKFLAESFMATMSGPLYLVWRSARGKGVLGAGEQAARLVFPYAVVREMTDMANGAGPYRDLTTFDKIGKFIKQKTPGLKAIDTGLAIFGLAQEDRGLDASISAFYRWRRDTLGWREQEDFLKEDTRKEFRVNMRLLIEALKRGDGDAMNTIYLRAAAASGKTGKEAAESIADSFRGRKLLKTPDNRALTLEQKDALRNHIGDSAYDRLEYFDEMLEQAAKGHTMSPYE